MKKLLKAFAVVLSAALVLMIASCSYEAGYANEMPEAASQPSEWSSSKSETPVAPTVNTPEVPEVPSESGDLEYKVVYNGSVIETVAAEELAFYELVLEPEEYTIDESTKTITLTQSGYNTIVNLMNSI